MKIYVVIYLTKRILSVKSVAKQNAFQHSALLIDTMLERGLLRWALWLSLTIVVSVPRVHAFVPSGSFGITGQTHTRSTSAGTGVDAGIARELVRTRSAVADAPAEAAVSPAEIESISQPKGSANAWEVHKFGGASLATAELYRTVGDLLIEEAGGRDNGAIPTMAIVSARGGMTDLLVEVMDSALLDFEQAKDVLNDAVESQIALLKELAPSEVTKPIEERFRNDASDILSVVQSLRMIQTVPAVTMEVVTGFGEIWSAQTLHAYLQTKGVPCAWIDARDVLVVKSDSAGLGEKGEASTGGVVPLWDETASRMSTWWNTAAKDQGFHKLDYSSTNSSPIVVITGFVATTATGVPTTLKRSGSDYSATVFAKLTGAGRVTMWKNTNGIYTADPRRVPEAFPIASLKYDEAMELAYFGAQVLHPSAMVPCIDDSIPVYIRNIFNPSFEGTIITGRCQTLEEVSKNNEVKNWRSNKGEVPIKGITSVDKTSLVTLEGASVIGGANVAERFMGAMADNGINVLIITQASSESSICVAVPENQGSAALAALEDSFELELSRSTINSVSLQKGMAIVAIVGEGMAMNSGVSSTFMSSLSKANVNIRLIAQGSSERQIAVVVKGDDTSRALRAAHMAFTLSATTASITILGSTGHLGSALVKQLQDQKENLAGELGFEMRVNCAATSSKMVYADDFQGLDISRIAELMEDDNETVQLDLDRVSEIIEKDVNPQRVIIDCTDSEKCAEYYERWLAAGINVISPGRKVSAGKIERYCRVQQVVRDNSVNWQYESSVGSALPILTTLRDLQETGDKVEFITGSVSGTMAYVLSSISETNTFSEAVRQAVEQGFCENDPRVDLTGRDSALKAVILARQLGLEIELEDVEVESLIPDAIAEKAYIMDKKLRTEEVLEDLKSLDASMLERVKDAAKEDKRLRYKIVIEKKTGKCKCSLEAVGTSDALYRLKSNENLVSFETARYTTSPLIVKGAAAGPELAASGIFADLLRLTRAYSSSQA